MMFAVGQKIVCVDDSDTYGAARAHGVFKGKIYTVTGYTMPGHVSLQGIVDGWGFDPGGHQLLTSRSRASRAR